MMPGRGAEPVYDASEYSAAGENEETSVWSWRGKWSAKNNLTRDGNYALLPSTKSVQKICKNIGTSICHLTLLVYHPDSIRNQMPYFMKLPSTISLAIQ